MLTYEFTNPHPDGKLTIDCVVRAITLAFNKDYLETRRDLNKAKKDLNFKSYKDTRFLYKYLKNYERLIIKAEAGQSRMRASDFVWKYGKGTYIVKMASHIACIKDCKLLDTWDSSEKTIYTAWRIK